ncbi:hypothetical protein [Chondromyces crocatus]|uniref:Uncharacterized protein n=1 Tax=Chondromyces crocatus TaxID=52 RepID=A0A0K1ESE7_CHOCO|nr:hypothetical protein [Chondromyces crocatus]AKT43719.1 uncharacterized protein CMC5_079540 [Chondromyces crocatus]
MNLATHTSPTSFWKRGHRAALVVLMGLAASGCAEAGAEQTARGATPQGHAETMTFSGNGVRARVTRGVNQEGLEKLHGETLFEGGADAGRRVVEDVTLDPAGRLVSATVSLSAGEVLVARMQLDAVGGVVRVSTPEGAAEQRVTTDTPWVYAPPWDGGQVAGAKDEAAAAGCGELEGAGITIATPVAAWVMLRAGSAHTWVRRIDLDRREGWLIPQDQVAVRHEQGTTAVIGPHAADAGEDFVEEVRLTAPHTTLARVRRGERLVL